MIDLDAIQLFDEDRKRFLVHLREFLQSDRIPQPVKFSEVRSTLDVLRQMAELVGPK